MFEIDLKLDFCSLAIFMSIIDSLLLIGDNPQIELELERVFEIVLPVCNSLLIFQPILVTLLEMRLERNELIRTFFSRILFFKIMALPLTKNLLLLKFEISPD